MKSYEVITPVSNGTKKPHAIGSTIKLDDDTARDLIASRAIRPMLSETVPDEATGIDNIQANLGPDPATLVQPVVPAVPAQPQGVQPTVSPFNEADATAELAKLERDAIIDIIDAETVKVKKNVATDAMIAAIVAHRKAAFEDAAG